MERQQETAELKRQIADLQKQLQQRQQGFGGGGYGPGMYAYPPRYPRVGPGYYWR